MSIRTSSAGTVGTLLEAGDILSASLTDEGLKIWDDGMTVLTPWKDRTLDHSATSTEGSFDGFTEDSLQALEEIQTEDTLLQRALRESIAYNRLVIKKRFHAEVVRCHRLGGKPVTGRTNEDQALVQVIHQALVNVNKSTMWDYHDLEPIVRIALSLDIPNSFTERDWAALVRDQRMPRPGIGD